MTPFVPMPRRAGPHAAGRLERAFLPPADPPRAASPGLVPARRRFVPEPRGGPPSAVIGGRESAAPTGRERAAVDLGALTPYARDPTVTDLLVTGDGSLWSDSAAGLVEIAHRRWNEEEARALAVRLVALGGRHIDEANPCVDVRLHDGIRVHAVLPPISTTGAVLSVRLPGARRLSLADLCRDGTLDDETATMLRTAVEERRNLLITGATGSGKTTLLAALLSEVGPAERLVVIEDVAELRIRHPHVVGLEARQPNLEGAGGVGLARLLREALRMRPDRIVLGECRGAEIRELLTALNTGHDGGAGTLHANSLADVPSRLEALGALAGMSDQTVARQTVSALDLVVHVEREGARRRVAGTAHLALDDAGRLCVEP
ncbi:MAG TPA: TadA family conjugal transfer-associated ATPase [Microbacteriaceae bacterium]|nr:TadA family conjugal transfer-associated ATPase [Microbacteriaceae bacterium]